MPRHLPHYGPAEGPLGFPMPDKQARALDTLLKTLPKSREFEYRKALVARAPANRLHGTGGVAPAGGGEEQAGGRPGGGEPGPVRDRCASQLRDCQMSGLREVWNTASTMTRLARTR